MLFEGALEEQLARAERIQAELSADATVVARTDQRPVMSAYLQSLNGMSDVQSERVYIELFARVPGVVIATIAELSLLTMVLAGYLLGFMDKRW